MVGRRLNLQQGLKRYSGAVAAYVFCWWAEADEGSPRTAYKNKAATRHIQAESPPAAQINMPNGEAGMHGQSPAL